MERNKNFLFFNLVFMLLLFIFDGCSGTQKEIIRKPYKTNTYLYREIYNNNSIAWKVDLRDDMENYKLFLKNNFKDIDNYKNYLFRMNNKNNIQVKQRKRQKVKTDSNSNSFFEDSLENEYSF